MYLEQGSMIVAEYLPKFTRLERFPPGICTTMTDRAKRFKKGLHLDILESIATVVFPTLFTAIDAATEYERICIHKEKCRAGPIGDWKD